MDKSIAMKFVLLVIMITTFVISAPGDACIEREREALLSFKKELIDDYGVLTSWQTVDQECCKWFGVVCSNATGHVISLNLQLASTPLRGKVASSLLELHHLMYLNLNWNHFGGIPIPQFIGSMKQLQHLHLSGSRFSGNIPPQIGNLINLRSIDLSANSFNNIKNLDWLSSLSLLSFLDLSTFDLNHTDSLQHIVKLRSLRELNLRSCRIGDNVKPFANSSFTSLSILHLSDNYLSRSSSFDWLSNTTTSLISLDLSFNALNGSILNALLERLIHIENLNISANMVEGEIPKSLGDLSHLRVLVSSQNNHRHFDELFGNLSNKEILQSLQILDLSWNELNGTVPDLRAFSSLTDVDFTGNNFTKLPLSIGQLPKLQVLDISSNSLEGTVSESHFIKLHSLKTLDLSYNSLLIFDMAPDWSPPFQLDRISLGHCKVGPSFPKWIKTQRNFSFLYLVKAGIKDEAPGWLWTTSPFLDILLLSDNQISGTIPNLSTTSISYLDLSNNKFSGPIPLFYANVSFIQLSGNMFSGSISSICENLLNHLWELDLSNNQWLRGEVPNCGEKMPNLGSLNLANNSFSGGIPRSLGSCNHLKALHLRDNNLSGELPSSLRLLHEIEMIDVGGNELTGEIPAWIGDMYNMLFLNLGTNKFHGSVPPGICNLTHIRILDLSINNLSGKIPDCFNNFTALTHNGSDYYSISFSYHSSFQWKGREREYREKYLMILKLIDFSSNRFTGNIPRSFSSMIVLNSLNLSRNALSGNIIPNIGQMENLDSLDLSDNQFSGEIPSSLAKIYNIGFLNLSNNLLSGKIPTSTQLQSFDASSYGGNDGLCGPPLALCQNDSLMPSPPATFPRENMNEEEGIFSFMQEVGISMGFGFIFGFWGVVCSLFLKKSWRNAYFTFFDAVGDWFYVRTALFVSKWRPS